jgi:hypothetical protein
MVILQWVYTVVHSENIVAKEDSPVFFDRRS